MTTATRERILTDNEKYGSGFLDEDAPGGVWVVMHHKHFMRSGRKVVPGTSATVAHLFSNRRACEDYIYAKCDEHLGRTPDDYSIQVWAVSDTWPDEDEA